MYTYILKTIMLIPLFSLTLYPLMGNALSIEKMDPAENSFKQKVGLDIEPFTGKITRNKVRMRLQPSLDAPILSEFASDDLLNVVGEKGEFYEILPPKDTRAYIFRTFVLDGIVEGNRVNVRLEPALESPVIAQLNSGDSIDGVVSALSSKWLEIAPPSSTRFYVCKEYVEKIGTASLMQQIEKRRTEANALLSSAQLSSIRELQKNYQEINLESVYNELNTLITHYSDFSKYVNRAKVLLSSVQESYLKKKITYLEAKTLAMETLETAAKNENDLKPFNTEQMAIRKEKALLLDDSFLKPSEKIISSWETPFDPDKMTPRMTLWIPHERLLYEAWRQRHQNGTPREFYEEQLGEIVELKGIIEPYKHPIKTKPGDYLLISPFTKLPIAYIYSTRVDLFKNQGQEVLVQAVKRPNYNFAFPAYYVISVE